VSANADMNVPVLVVGGGPAGLMTSLLLARHRVRSLLVERHPGTSVLPRAAGINVRTMEIFRAIALDQEVEANSHDSRGQDFLLEMTTLGGPIVETVPFLSGGDPDAPDSPSPSRFAFCSQDVLEPLLVAGLKRYQLCEPEFGTELVDFQQDGSGVRAELRERASGRVRQVRAEYMVAADGARSHVREALRIPMRGHDHLTRELNILFEADLSEAVRGRRAILHRVTHPMLPGRAIFRNLDGRGHRWTLFLPWFEDASPERCADVIRLYADDAQLKVDVNAVGEWERATLLVDRFRAGRIFLAGDAAHRLTPSGALGMNTAIQTVHNLAWKLAAVLQGWAGPGLLDSYEAERRLVGGNAVELSYWFSGQHPLAMSRILGHVLGSAYDVGALLPDGTPPPGAADPVAEYVPSARPGHRAPHRWLMVDGRRISTLDLFDGRFVLLSPSEVWCVAARDVGSALAVPLVAYVINDRGWSDLYEVGPRGAVLVRPDGYVAWRRQEAVADPRGELSRLLASVLDLGGRRMPAQAGSSAAREAG
jgi:putative polyketide hydroxylase